MPRAGRHSGFVHFESEGPVAVTTDLFEVTSRDDAAVTDVTSGRVVAERTDEVTLPMEKFQTAVLMLD